MRLLQVMTQARKSAANVTPVANPSHGGVGCAQQQHSQYRRQSWCCNQRLPCLLHCQACEQQQRQETPAPATTKIHLGHALLAGGTKS